MALSTTEEGRVLFRFPSATTRLGKERSRVAQPPVWRRRSERVARRTVEANSPEGDTKPRGDVLPQVTEHALESVVDYKAERGLRCRWAGYDSRYDTWEPPRHVPWNKARAYFRRRRLEVPPKLRAECRAS